MSDQKQPSASLDDFQKIKGIGEITEKTLHKLGINTYQDLARYSSTQLVDLLKGKISDLSLHRILKDDWSAQAKKLINGKSHDTGDPLHSTPQQETWRELADFFISFGYAVDANGIERLQTKAHHSQADKLRKWDGIALDQLVAWLLKQAHLPVTAMYETKSVEYGNSETDLTQKTGETIRMTLSDVMVSQVAGPVDPRSNDDENFLRVESQLNLLDDTSSSSTADQVPYSVEIYLIDVLTNQSSLVEAYSDYLPPSAHSCHISRDINIPQTGRYQLILLTRLLPPLIGIAQAQGPLIRVEA